MATYPPGYHSIADAAAQLGLSRQRLYVILRSTRYAGRAWLSDAEIRALRRRPKGRPGRPRTSE